jgi:hypothetical protein
VAGVMLALAFLPRRAAPRAAAEPQPAASEADVVV